MKLTRHLSRVENGIGFFSNLVPKLVLSGGERIM